METSYRKTELRIKNYRDCKSFSNEGFREPLLENLKGKLSENSDKNFSNFIDTRNTVLDKQLRKKKSILEVINRFLWIKLCLKKLCEEQDFHQNKKFIQNKSNENKTNYMKQRNLCVFLLRKVKRDCYSNLDEKNICNNKTFWEVVKLMLFKKIKSNKK